MWAFNFPAGIALAVPATAQSVRLMAYVGRTITKPMGPKSWMRGPWRREIYPGTAFFNLNSPVTYATYPALAGLGGLAYNQYTNGLGKNSNLGRDILTPLIAIAALRFGYSRRQGLSQLAGKAVNPQTYKGWGSALAGFPANHKTAWKAIKYSGLAIGGAASGGLIAGSTGVSLPIGLTLAGGAALTAVALPFMAKLAINPKSLVRHAGWRYPKLTKAIKFGKGITNPYVMKSGIILTFAGIGAVSYNIQGKPEWQGALWGGGLSAAAQLGTTRSQ